MQSIPSNRVWGLRLAGGGALVAMAVFLARAPLPLAAAVIAGAACLVALIVEPAVGLIALALLIPFGALVPVPLPGVNAVDLLVALIAAAWLARGIACRQIVFRPPPLTWPILAFVWIAGVSLTQAASWREGLPEWLKWVEFAALYLVAAQLLDGTPRFSERFSMPGAAPRRTKMYRNPPDCACGVARGNPADCATGSFSGQRWLMWVLAGLAAAGLAEVALGVYQFARQAGPAGFVLMGRFMRAYGTLGQPNPYAGYLGYLAPVAASLALGWLGAWWRARRQRDLWLGVTCGAVTALLALGIGVSWSRGAWLGLAAALVAVVGARSRRTVVLTITALLLLALAITLFGTGWLPGAITGRLADLGGYFAGPDPALTEINDENFAVLERLAHWNAGLRMFDDHPWLGVGIGNYGVAYAEYAPPHWYDALGHAHNVYINFLAETGLLGAGAFAIFWLAAAWHVLRTILRGNDPEHPEHPERNGAFLRSAVEGCGHARRGASFDSGPQKSRASAQDASRAGQVEHPERSQFRKALAIGILGTLIYLSIHNLFDNLFVQHTQLQLALLLGGLAAMKEARS